MQNVNFECKQCGNCCRQPGYVYLKDGEAEGMAKLLDIDVYEFTEKYCVIQDRLNLVLKMGENEDCLFLKNNNCLVYDARPEQCRDFPKKWNTPKSKKYCEGRNNGLLHKKHSQ